MNVYAPIQCFILIITFNAATAWKYGEEENWSPLCQDGKRQSPIALSESIATETTFEPFTFTNYDKKYPAQVTNNGHSAKIELPLEVKPTVRGGGLPYEYTLDHLHFHWSSEHTINRYRFPLEMHLVHYATSYGSVDIGLRYDGGIAVISVLFDLSPDDDYELIPLIEVISKVHDHIGVPETKNFDMKNYLPRDISGFYRYNGSLTTPDCSEGILWTIFTDTIPISRKQVEHFKTMQDEYNHELPKNYRSLQSLNGRTIFLKVSPIRNSSQHILGSILTCIILFSISQSI